MEKNFKITNKKQMEKLVDLMKMNPEIGRGKLPFGCSKMYLKEKLDTFSDQLNSLGPPIKTTKEWQRVWTNYKANLKRKLTSNKRNFQSTGGGPFTEVSLEQSTVELVSMQTQVSPSGSAMGLATQRDSDGAESTFRPEEPSTSVKCTEPPLVKNRKALSNIRKDERLAILKSQSKNQEEISKSHNY